MTDTSGPPLRTPFAFYDPDESCWRTSQATFLSDSDRYSETWPRSGTTHAGYAYELLMPALRMAAPACSSSRHRTGSLLPTPEAKLSDSGPDYARADRPDSGGDDLTTTLHRLFPTPRATDGTKGGPNQRGSSGDLMLPSAVQALLPTPSVSDATGGHLTRGGARSDELLLPGVAKSLTLLPTPKQAADRTSRGALTRQGHWSVPALAQAVELAQGILPREYEDWTEVQGWHGALTPPPSLDGSESPDVQSLDLLSPDPEAESA